MKKNHQKFTETALCALIIVAAVAVAIFSGGTVSAADKAKPLELADVSQSPAANEILSLVNDGVLPIKNIDGYAYFYPSAKVTREYIATALAKISRLDASKYQNVALGVADENAVSAENLLYVRAAAYAGLIPVYVDDGGENEVLYFYPATEVSRQAAAYLVSGIVDRTASSSEINKFSDKNEISAEFASDVDKLVALGIMSGYPDGTFRPNETITREELAFMLYKAKTLGYVK